VGFETASNRLDKLHSRNVKCPYCKGFIPKFQSTCERCGVSKKQLKMQAGRKPMKSHEGSAKARLFSRERRQKTCPLVDGLLFLSFLAGLDIITSG